MIAATTTDLQRIEQLAGSRAKAWQIVWKDTHSDYKGTSNGVRSVMSWAAYGGGLVSESSITHAELLERLQSAIGKS